ncbi:PepSY domain-containing protein [Algivirga pacifica]|uniref:PepSY domain-containing protein n=1 Tax=Algivirga pacifica TaxID=1162670 RepID=A0ABP9D8D7_9BACT
MRMKQKVYQWHRKISIIALVPVLFWTLSGIMHPLMSNFKPQLAQRFVRPTPVDFSGIQLSLDSVLRLQAVDSLQNFRVVNLAGKSYYQVNEQEGQALRYFDAISGEELVDGDHVYAKQVATAYAGEQAGAIKSITQLTAYDDEYLEIFRLLPVYRVNFENEEGLRLYIHTASGQLGTSMNNARANWLQFFRYAHSWSFLDGNTPLRITVLIILAIAALLSAGSGIYVYGVMFKVINDKKKASRVPMHRRLHRGLGIGMSFALLMFALSAIAHMLPKYTPDNRLAFNNNYIYTADELSGIVFEEEVGIVNYSLARMGEETYLQKHYASKRGTQIKYQGPRSAQVLDNGDEAYAKYLANKFAQKEAKDIASVTAVTKFKGEYGFINKLLPVYKVQYKAAGNERIYVHTPSGKMAARVVDKEALSGFIFAYFHKYHFLDFAGKVIRDSIMVIFAAGNFLVALLGLIMLLKKQSAPQKKEKGTLVS